VGDDPPLSAAFPRQLTKENESMKHHLLTGVAVAAALAFAAPVWAQGVSPSGGNSMGMPGPNPGGPGLTPYSGGAPRTMAAPTPSAAPAAMAPAAAAPAPGDASSAMPPSHHRHARHAMHGKPPHHPSHFSNLQGNVANQLNQEELARLQAPPSGMPPAPPPPGPMAAPPPPRPLGTSGGGAPYRP
jgi:hypothetical protein